MTPKKAIIILSVVFLIIVAVFVFLYFNKQFIGFEITSPARVDNIGSPLPARTGVEQKINEIINEAKINSGKYTEDEVRQSIVDAINEEIKKQEENKTPEQRAADLKAQVERQKIIDQINIQIQKAAKE